MKRKKNILAIIPARSDSKRLKNKNLREIGGKHLVEWIIEAAINTRLLTRIILSSDDEKILNLASQYNNITKLKRPEKISGDKSLAIEYVRHVLNEIEDNDNPFEYIIILQPSSPFTTNEDIENTIRLLEDANVDSSATVCELDHALHPKKIKLLKDLVLLPYFEDERGLTAAHQIPKLYIRNGSVYASKRRVIDSGKIIGDVCKGYVMPRERSIDINDEFDLEFANFLYEKNEF